MYVLRPLAGAVAPAAAQGLSKCHSSPVGSLLLYRGASLAKFESPTRGGVRAIEPPKRGCITCFSARSRQRLRIKMAKVRKDARPLFCTLTYPNEWLFNPDLWKTHLDNFAKRLLRRYPNAGAIWKLEMQQRGAPHFHPFVFGIEDGEPALNEFREWLSQAWFEIVGSNDAKHLLAGTRAERLRTMTGAIRYVSGYASKEDQTWQHGQNVGRYWGVTAGSNIPRGDPQKIELSAEQSKLVRRTLRRYILAINRERRIHFIARQIALSADDVRRSGWFEGKREFFTKHLRRCGVKTVPKLRLRNTDNLNVFLNADFWAEKLRKLLSLTPSPHLSSKLSSAADMLSSKQGHSAADDWNPYTVKFKRRQGFAEFMTAVRNVFPNAVLVGKAGVNFARPEQLRIVLPGRTG